MALAPELSNAIMTQLNKFGNDLNLSRAQRLELQGLITEAIKKSRAYRQRYPNASRADFIKKIDGSRALLRRRLVNFFTPEQLTKWDAELAQATEMPGHLAA